jgi:hypothetical protein
MFHAIPWLVEAVTRRLQDVIPRSTVAKLAIEPAMGAVRLALREAREGVRIPPYLDTISRTSR